jgi:Gpi18-like mannosyltransferase
VQPLGSGGSCIAEAALEDAEHRPTADSAGPGFLRDPHRLPVLVGGVLGVAWSLLHGNPGDSTRAAVLAHVGGVLLIAIGALVAARTLDELRGRRPVPRSGSLPAPPAAEFSRAEKAGVFAGALALQFLVLYCAYRTTSTTGSLSDFWHLFRERFTNGGDNPHYLYIAEHGYPRSGDQANQLVFFPLYPAALWLGHLLVGSYTTGGLLISWLCWGGACVTVLDLAALHLDRSRALVAVGLLALYPFSFFSMGLYTESMFLLLSGQCLLRLERGQWRTAGVIGFLAALCRTQGFLLVLPAVFLWAVARRRSASLLDGAFLLLIPGGLGAYLLLNRIVAGSWTAFRRYERAAPWYQSTHWVTDNLIQQYGMAKAYPGLASFIYIPQIVLFFVVVAVLYYGYATNAPTALLIYGGSYLTLTYLSGWMISGPRYVFGCLPLFLVAARPRHRAWQIGLPVVSGVLLTSYATLYLQGQSIF